MRKILSLVMALAMLLSMTYVVYPSAVQVGAVTTVS